jgi:hypothetical protein
MQNDYIMVQTPSRSAGQKLFSEEPHSAVNALAAAQAIAFAPYVFQASVLLRDWGLLDRIGKAGKSGASFRQLLDEFPERSKYALRVLLEGGLGIGLLLRNENDHFVLTKTGHFFDKNQMTVANTNFMRDVCLPGVEDLEASLERAKPAGLRHLGDWSTIYEGLSKLSEPVQKSWFEFDHYYSDIAFPEAIDFIFRKEDRPQRLLELGSNTGKWANISLGYCDGLHLGLVDLPPQLEMARKSLANEGLEHRASFHPQNILDAESPLPRGFDAVWMSQFLDCFSDEEIVRILRKCYDALPDEGAVYINETFWDRQRFAASAFSLQMITYYFTTMANGNSQMYDSKVFFGLVEEAGFRVVDEVDNVGIGHTLLKLKKVNS